MIKYITARLKKITHVNKKNIAVSKNFGSLKVNILVFFLAHAPLHKLPFDIHKFHSYYVTQDYERLASLGTLSRKMKQTITPRHNPGNINFV